VRILIRNGRVIDPKNGIDDTLDLLIEETVVTRVDRRIQVSGSGVRTIDAKGLVVAPGLIDVHAHLREPGYEYKETIKTGTLAAARGGFTTVVCMANTYPVNDNRSITEFISERARVEGSCRVLPCGAITKGLKGEELAEIGEMVQAGIVAISDDGRSVRNAALMTKALEYAKLFGIPAIAHCEDDDLSKGHMHEGRASLIAGIDAVPSIAEEIIVQRDIAIARYVGSPIHLTHISTKGSMEIIGQAKRKYKKVTCDTCPHYFTLTDEAVLEFNTNAKVNPPLRSKEDVEAVREGLRTNVIDIIATDHAPHELSSKDVEFNLATNGISGLETALALSLRLVHEGILTLPHLVQKFTEMPARLLNLPQGQLAPGALADLIIFDPLREWTVDPGDFLSKGKNTPFHGWKLKGTNLLTLVGGRVLYQDPSLGR
jgi:dihydroorotase